MIGGFFLVGGGGSQSFLDTTDLIHPVITGNGFFDWRLV
jgi:hypothetical protein